MNSGAFLTLNRLAVLMPRVSLSTRATFTRFLSAAPTEKHQMKIENGAHNRRKISRKFT